jgi:hypothetical protein
MWNGGLISRASWETRLLALGGVHIFDTSADCRLSRVEPQSALKDLKWSGQLAVEATSEGEAEVKCGSDSIRVQIVKPERLEIVLVHGDPSRVRRGDRINVRAKPYGPGSQDLEPGKFTDFGWASSPQLQPDNERSSVEFGFCDTCFGMYRFRAVEAGMATITARLFGAQGQLDVVIGG